MLQDSPGIPSGDAARQGWRSRLLHRVAHVDTPRRAAIAFALGVFLSFSPFLGFQVAIGMGTAVVLRLSRLAVFAGLCMNLPWFMVPWYTLTTVAAAAVLGTPVGPELGASLSQLFEQPVYEPVFWAHAGQVLSPLLWAFLLGSTGGAAILGVITYVSTARMFARVRLAAAAQRAA